MERLRRRHQDHELVDQCATVDFNYSLPVSVVLIPSGTVIERGTSLRTLVAALKLREEDSTNDHV
jgi:hypothetical protein